MSSFSQQRALPSKLGKDRLECRVFPTCIGCLMIMWRTRKSDYRTLYKAYVNNMWMIIMYNNHVWYYIVYGWSHQINNNNNYNKKILFFKREYIWDLKLNLLSTHTMLVCQRLQVNIYGKQKWGLVYKVQGKISFRKIIGLSEKFGVFTEWYSTFTHWHLLRYRRSLTCWWPIQANFECWIKQHIFYDFSALGDLTELIPFTMEHTSYDTRVEYPQHVILGWFPPSPFLI